MSLALDIDVARAMGYRVVRDRDNVRGFQIGAYGRKGHDLPRYSEDYALIPVLTAWIDVHGLRIRYVGALLDTIHGMPDDWQLLTATPEQHCRAFIACTQGERS